MILSLFVDNPKANNESMIQTFKVDKSKETGSAFMRKGKTNTYKDEMSEELIRKFDKKTEEIYRKVGFLKYCKLNSQ